jgi:hypothetical protein
LRRRERKWKEERGERRGEREKKEDLNSHNFVFWLEVPILRIQGIKSMLSGIVFKNFPSGFLFPPHS